MAPSDLWAEAIKSLDETDKSMIWGYATNKLKVLDDVIESAKAKQAESMEKKLKYTKRDKTEGEVHHLIGRAVDKIAQFKHVGDGAVRLDVTGHSAVPWAALGLGLEVAVNYFDRDRLAHEGIQMLTILVPRYTVFERLYLEEESQIKNLLKGELIKLYSSTLTFTTGLKKYYEKRTIGRAVDAVYKSFEELSASMDAIRVQQVIVEDLARLIDAERVRGTATETQEKLRNMLDQFKNPIQSIHDGMMDLVSHLEAEKQGKILDWLSKVSHDHRHQELREGRLKGSGLWIFADPHYKEWRGSTESCFLLLQGQPGTGKSTLMSLIIDSVRANEGTTQPGPLAYIYCSRNKVTEQDSLPAAIPRGIVKQLSRGGPGRPIRGAVVQKYKSIHEQGEGSEVLASSDTRKLLLELVDQGSTMIFIDAIDECTPSQREELFQLIPDLLNNAKGIVKIFMSSRPSWDISSRIQRYDKTYMVDMDRNEDDIRMFAAAEARKCIEGMKRRNEENVAEDLQTKLTEELVRGGQKMFLWVKLQVDILSNPLQTEFEEDVLERVRTTPPELSEFYSTIYERIKGGGNTVKKMAKILFQWLLCAEIPLHKDRIIEILSASVSTKNLTENTVLDSCGNLVMMDEELQTFRFIHTSVKDFFEDQVEFSLVERHATVAEFCLGRVVEGVALSEEPSFNQESLQCFVILYWMPHFEQVGMIRRNSDMQEALRDLCMMQSNENTWFGKWLRQLERVYGILEWNDPFKDKIVQALCSPETPFFAACAFGLVEVIRWYQGKRPDLFTEKNNMGATGLHLACQYGHHTVAEELLIGRANIDSKDNYGETALIRACSAGHDNIAALLLGEKANVRIQGRKFGTALQAAALRGHIDILRRLVDYGVDIEAEGGQFGTALQAASLRGHLKVVKELMRMGADVNALAGDYETVYDIASSTSIADEVNKAVAYLIEKAQPRTSERYISEEEGNENSMQLLLDRTLDMNLKKSGFGPALHAACRAGHQDVVKELLRAPQINVDIEGGRYGSALQAAAVCGNVEIVKLLLDARAEVNAQNGTYGTPLIAACRRAHYEVAEFLLKNGAAVDVRVGVYGTALQAAARSGNCDLVGLLLDHKANPNLKAGTYCTPLQAAARDGFDTIIALLLKRGGDPSIEGGSFGSALQAAAGAGHLSTVKLLISKDASLGSALQVACLGGHGSVVEFLMEQGADITAESPVFGSAVYAATTGGHLGLVQTLLSKTKKGQNSTRELNTALHLAAMSGNDLILTALLDRGADPIESVKFSALKTAHQLSGNQWDSEYITYCSSSLEWAATKGHISTVKLLLEKITDSPKSKKQTLVRGKALRAGARYGRSDIVDLLIDGNRVDSPYLDLALWDATKGRHAAIVRSLLANGALTSRHTIKEACTWGSTEILQLVLKWEPTERLNLRADYLFLAAFHGHPDAVRILLNRGADVNALTTNNHLDCFGTDAHWEDDESGVHWEDDELDVHWEDDELSVHWEVDELGVTALHAAVYGGHKRVVDLLLEYKARLDTRGEMMATVLQIASFTGRLDIVQTLLSKGADVNAVSGTFGTALQAAARAGSIEVVDSLLGRPGIDVNQKSGMYGTALQASAARGNEAIVQRLLNAGADPKREGGEPRGWAEALQTLLVLGPKNRWNSLSRMWRGVPQRSQSGKYGTSLQAAAKSGNVWVVELLLENGADIRDVDKHGQTPLHRAACCGHDGVVNLLLKNDANPDDEDMEGRTPLLMAAGNGWAASLMRLVGAGATNGIRDVQGDTALHRAAVNGHITILERLIDEQFLIDTKNDEDQTALILAAKNGRSSAVRFLLNKGSNIDLGDENGDTALHEAARHGHDAVVRLLLARGADTNRRNDQGNTVLHESIPTRQTTHSKHFDVVYLLTSHLIDKLEMANEEGATVLHHAAGSRDYDIVELLIQKGANCEARDSMGQTPLHYSVIYPERGNPMPIIRLLVLSGADIHATTNDGTTVLQAAEEELCLDDYKRDTERYITALENAENVVDIKMPANSILEPGGYESERIPYSSDESGSEQFDDGEDSEIISDDEEQYGEYEHYRNEDSEYRYGEEEGIEDEYSEYESDNEVSEGEVEYEDCVEYASGQKADEENQVGDKEGKQ